MTNTTTAHGTTTALRDALAEATTAGNKTLSARYGAGTEAAHVRVALVVSRIINDDAARPTSGGTASKVGAILVRLAGDAEATPGDALAALREASAAGNPFDDAALVAHVVVVSAALADAEAARRATERADREARRAIENNKSLPLAERVEAARQRMELQAQALDKTAEGVAARAVAALVAAHVGGVAPEYLASLVVAALGATPAVRLADALRESANREGGI